LLLSSLWQSKVKKKWWQECHRLFLKQWEDKDEGSCCHPFCSKARKKKDDDKNAIVFFFSNIEKKKTTIVVVILFAAK
jgi:hypothetical protein